MKLLHPSNFTSVFLLVLSVVSVQGSAGETWFPFGPPVQDFREGSVIDLRYLNEKFAGENGWIETEGEKFVHSDTGEAVRFWSANIAPRDDFSQQDWQYLARLLAKYGINHLRIHGNLLNGFAYTRVDQRPQVDPMALSEDKLSALMKCVAAMKAEGIYSHLSFYFPLWIAPPADDEDWPGYDGKTSTFGAIYFNDHLIQKYEEAWKAALTRVNPHTGLALIDDPAVMGVEMVNEDSLFFGTFSYRSIPAPQMQIIEQEFAEWLTEKHGSLDKVEWLASQPHERDDPAVGQIGFGDLNEMAQRRSLRDRETITFLYEFQRDWYADRSTWFRELGFKGLITASNWITANDSIYDGIERATYLSGDFIDHHKAYYGGRSSGENSNWSIRKGHSYFDRSQLKFDSANPARSDHSWELTFVKPTWNNMPTMISETSWTRPNRHRSESVGIYAAYGSMHDIDAIVHFTLDSHGRRWTVQPRYVMQQWTMQSPAVMGQFPAAALIYRKGLVQPAPAAAQIHVNINRQLAFEGLSFAQDDGVDALREDENTSGSNASGSREKSGLRTLAGRTHINIADTDGESSFMDLADSLDIPNQRATSLTGELMLDWGSGFLRIDAPQAQGFLLSQPVDEPLRSSDLTLETDAEIFNLLLVSLDSEPLRTSQRMLLQVMTEEKNTDFAIEKEDNGMKRILNIGIDPWLVRSISGELRFEGEPVNITALDQAGYPMEKVAEATQTLNLLPDVVYYLIER